MFELPLRLRHLPRIRGRMGGGLLLLALLTSCSLKKIAVRQATGFFAESRQVFEMETDLELAEVSIAANLKLLEAMQVHDPHNEDLNLLIAFDALLAEGSVTVTTVPWPTLLLRRICPRCSSIIL